MAAEHLDHAVPTDDFLEHVRNRAGSLLHVAGDPAESPAEVARHRGDQRQNDDEHDRALPVEIEQKSERADDREEAAHRGRDRAGARCGELIGIEREFGDEPARRLRVVVGGRQREQPLDHLLPEIEYNPVAGPRHSVFGHE